MQRHDLDVMSLIAGAVFVALGLAFLLGAVADFHVELRWVWPPLLVGLGIALLVGSRPRRGA